MAVVVVRIDVAFAQLQFSSLPRGVSPATKVAKSGGSDSVTADMIPRQPVPGIGFLLAPVLGIRLLFWFISMYAEHRARW